MSKAAPISIDNDFIKTFDKSTPFFLFSKNALKEKYEEFKACFPDAGIFFAMKANSEIETLETLRDLGCGFEVASKYELDILKSIKVNPNKIIFGTAVKPADAIREFFEYGVDKFAFDSLSELEKIADLAPGVKVYCRIIVNDTGSVYQFSEKFGTPKDNAVHYLSRAKELGLVPYGLSFHVGSQAGNLNAWAKAVSGLEDVINDLHKANIPIEIINIGGGYPCNHYTSTDNNFSLQDIADTFFKEYNKLTHKPQVILEPGRGICSDFGVLVASVIARVERGDHTWLFLDAGVYNALFETMAYQGSTRYRATSLRESFNSGEMLFALAGPTGDSWDVISREMLLPRDINVGDKVVFHNIGAYSTVCTSPFNGFPKPPVYFI